MADFWRINEPHPIQPSPSLPLEYFGQPLPLHLVAQDIFKVHNEEMSEEVHPKRVFFDEVNQIYIYADLHAKPVQIYFIKNNEHHSMLGSVLFAYTECLQHRWNEEEAGKYNNNYTVADFCIHGVEKGDFRFSFLLVNSDTRRVTLVRFCLARTLFEELLIPGPTPRTYHLDEKDIELIANVLHHKALDEMFVPSTVKIEVPPIYIPLGTIGGMTYSLPDVEKVVPKLEEHLYVGTLDPFYCGLTCTELGQYLVLIQSSITVWVSPFISLPVDVQYIVMLDEQGMMVDWILSGPLLNAVCFDETIPGQPYLTNPTIVEGRILVCLEHRKARMVRPAVNLLRSTNVNPPHTWYEVPRGNRNWTGGTVADMHVPHYMISGAHQGYVTEWDAPDGLLPLYRESVWQSVDVRRLLKIRQASDLLGLWHKMSLAHYTHETEPLVSLSVWGMHATTFLNYKVIRFSIDAAIFFERDPDCGGIPQTSITLSGLIPGETRIFEYYLKNNAMALSIKHPQLLFPTLPEGMTITVEDLPEVLCPGAIFPFKITASYIVPEGVEPEPHLVIPINIEYYLVPAKEVQEVTVIPSEVSLAIGQSYQLEYETLPEDACNKMMFWTSDNPSLVSVDNEGLITATINSDGGQTYVHATADETCKRGSCLVTVCVPVDSVTITPELSEVPVGTVLQLTATVLPENATNREIVWESSDPSLATVDEFGKVIVNTTPLDGTVYITATSQSTCGGQAPIVATATIKIIICVDSIQVTPPFTYATTMDSVQLTAVVLPEDATHRNDIIWVSKDTELATVDSNGLVSTKNKTGQVEICASILDICGYNEDCAIIDICKPVTSITVTPTMATINRGKTLPLIANVLPLDATNRGVTWTTSDPTAVTVDAFGVVTGVGACKSAIITAATNSRCGGQEAILATAEIYVHVPVTDVLVSPKPVTLCVGSTQQLIATVFPVDACEKAINWTSNNEAVATVSATGLVTALVAGTAIITATTIDGGEYDTCTVTVRKGIDSITIEPV